MNYFAHGRMYVDDPYFLAGTAVPDWLSVVDRKVRARSKNAATFVDDADPRVASLARGIVQHHHDDRWFHETRAFAELSMAFSRMIRELLPADDGLRPSFVGHILVEILLDAELIVVDTAVLDRYYLALDAADPWCVAEAVGQIARRDAAGLATLIPAFSRERFLPDYLSDAKLCFRLNQVMRRVKLPPLPESFAELLPTARREVSRRQHELLTPMAPNPV
jgi:hypothetical protein